MLTDAVVRDYAEHGLRDLAARYGLEGAEQRVCEIYKNHPALVVYVLKVYRDVLNGERKDG